ncbi:MAG: VOC family protein [Acidocella sp.]|nr:VOC family protein [Acidocella sp.]
MQGKFFWYDLMTTDIAAARKFYGEVVGWTAQDSGVSGENYTLFMADGHGRAGLMTIPPDAAQMGVPPCWTGYIHVDDVGAMAAKIVAEGGKIHRDTVEIPNVIRFAVMADPQGAGFIIATPLSMDAPPLPAPGAPGTVGWHELYAADWPAAFAFYEKLFGWTKADAIDMGPMGTYQLFCTGGPAVGGMCNKGPMPAPSWGYYFNVPQIDSAMQRVTASGGVIMMGPQQVPGGSWIMHGKDPQGADFKLVAPQR